LQLHHLLTQGHDLRRFRRAGGPAGRLILHAGHGRLQHLRPQLAVPLFTDAQPAAGLLHAQGALDRLQDHAHAFLGLVRAFELLDRLRSCGVAATHGRLLPEDRKASRRTPASPPGFARSLLAAGLVLDG